jgi:membrane fusion protein (multidrug efflux system)
MMAWMQQERQILRNQKLFLRSAGVSYAREDIGGMPEGRTPNLFLTLGVLGMGLLLAGCSPAQAPKKESQDNRVPVTVVAAETMLLDRIASAVGTLNARDEATISAEVDGRIEKIQVEIGDRVEQGAELVRVDTASYEAQANLSAANLLKAQASAVNAEANFKRVQELHKNNISSQSDLDIAQAQVSSSRAEVKAQEANVAMAQLNLERSHVKAPFAGIIADRMANTGDYVKTGATLFRMVNDTELKLMMQIPERLAGAVKTNQTVQFEVDALPGQKMTGSVYFVGPSVNTANRSFIVGARVDNGHHQLKANSYARGELILDRNIPSVTVPVDAVMQFSGISRVYVVDNNLARSRTVVPGRVIQGKQEILDGLKADEKVVLTGLTLIHDGSAIQIMGSTNTTRSVQK